MPPIHYKRPAIKPPAPSLAPAPTSMAPPNNDLFQEFMRTYIKRVQDQALVGEVRDKFDKVFKFQNPDLYYDYSYMECYYFCQQYKDNFEITGSQSHKRVFFAAGFLKDHILNWWQQHKTRIQCSQLAPFSWNKFKVF